jgi:hypothetical protein
MPRREIQVLFAPGTWGSSNRFETPWSNGALPPFPLRLD